MEVPAALMCVCELNGAPGTVFGETSRLCKTDCTVHAPGKGSEQDDETVRIVSHVARCEGGARVVARRTQYTSK